MTETETELRTVKEIDSFVRSTFPDGAIASVFDRKTDELLKCVEGNILARMHISNIPSDVVVVVVQDPETKEKVVFPWTEILTEPPESRIYEIMSGGLIFHITSA